MRTCAHTHKHAHFFLTFLFFFLFMNCSIFCAFRAVKDVTYVIHVASPFPSSQPKDENEVIQPAVEGTQSVLKACVATKTVKRVVLTSSCVAVNCKYVWSSKTPDMTSGEHTQFTKHDIHMNCYNLHVNCEFEQSKHTIFL